MNKIEIIVTSKDGFYTINLPPIRVQDFKFYLSPENKELVEVTNENSIRISSRIPDTPSENLHLEVQKELLKVYPNYLLPYINVRFI